MVNPEESAELSGGKSGFLRFFFDHMVEETANSSEKRNTGRIVHGQLDSLKTLKSLSPPGLFSG